MTGAGIFDGYILVVDKAKRPQPGDVVLAIVGAEFLVAGQAVAVRLRGAGDVDGEELEVWGVCVWVLQAL